MFSPDLDYLETLRSVQEALRPGAVPDHAAVVWVHPGAGGGRSGSSYYPGIESMVAGAVDAVEVYNGSWLDEPYVAIAEELAGTPGVARTGGSDAHDPAQLMTCYTELPDPVTGDGGRGRGAPGAAGRSRTAAGRRLQRRRFGHLLGGRHVDA